MVEPAGKGVIRGTVQTQALIVASSENYLSLLAQLNAREAAGENVSELYDELEELWERMVGDERRAVSRKLNNPMKNPVDSPMIFE